MVSQHHVRNILLLGETQSGKSNLAEGVQLYANPKYIIDKSKLGVGAESHTRHVIPIQVDTDLPTYYVIDQKTKAQDPYVNIGDLIDQSEDIEDFETMLGNKKGLEIHMNKPMEPRAYQFKILDTPGLNDTNGDDETHMSNIFKSLSSIGNIHLVLIVMKSDATFTKAFTNSIISYLTMFPEIRNLIACVHTKYHYKNIHPAAEQEKMKFDIVKSKLRGIIGKDCRHFQVDIDLESKRPIHKLITTMEIRKILDLAIISQQAISINSTMIYKTPKIAEIDAIIADKYRAHVKGMRGTLDVKSKITGSLFNDLITVRSDVDWIQNEIQSINEYIRDHDNDQAQFITEHIYENSWSLLKLNRLDSWTSPILSYDIQRVSILRQNSKVHDEEGGVAHPYYCVTYSRDSYADGLLHVKLFTLKSAYFRSQISERKSRLCYLQGILPRNQERKIKFEDRHQKEIEEIDKMIRECSDYNHIASLASMTKMSPRLFCQLVDSGAYKGETSSEIADKVVNVYWRELYTGGKLHHRDNPSISSGLYI